MLFSLVFVSQPRVWGSDRDMGCPAGKVKSRLDRRQSPNCEGLCLLRGEHGLFPVDLRDFPWPVDHGRQASHSVVIGCG
jgi:hypothetical protein